MVEAAILVQGLVKSYGHVRALRGVDLEVRRGEIFGYLGPNGAGKTTTIRCLLDLIRPDGGTVSVLGLNPQRQPVAVRRRVGYLPGELHLDPNLTVEETLRLFVALRGDGVDWRYVLDLVARLDLDLKPVIRNLSHGNKQKVGIVQALMHRPELLLLDEPTLGLDPLMQHEVLRLLSEARKAGTTIFFSSHIISEVEAVADRIAILRHGRVVEVSETAELVNRALRRVRVRFESPVDPAPLSQLPGVTVLAQDDATGLLLQVEGHMGNLIRALATFPVSDLDTERPSLEEIFLTYYKDSEEEV